MKKLFAILVLTGTLAACNGGDGDKTTTDTSAMKPAVDAAKTMDTANKMMADTANKMMNAAKDTASKMVDKAADKMKEAANKMVDKAKEAVKH